MVAVCRYCGKRLGVLGGRRDAEFCGPEHRRRFLGPAPARGAGFLTGMPPPSPPGGLCAGDPGLQPLALAVHRPGSWGLAIAPLAHRDFRAAALARPALPYGDLSDAAWMPSPGVRGPALEAGTPLALAPATWPAEARGKRGFAAARVRMPAPAGGPAAMVVERHVPVRRPRRPRLPRAAAVPGARIGVAADSFRPEEVWAAAGTDPRPAQAQAPLPGPARQAPRQQAAAVWSATVEVLAAGPREGGPQPARAASVGPASPPTGAVRGGAGACCEWPVALFVPPAAGLPGPVFRDGTALAPALRAADPPRSGPRMAEVALARAMAASLPPCEAPARPADSPRWGGYAPLAAPAAAAGATYATLSPAPRDYREEWNRGIVSRLPAPREARPRGQAFGRITLAAAAPPYAGMDEGAARASTPRDGWTGGIAGLLPQPRQARPRRTVFRTLALPAAPAPYYSGLDEAAVRAGIPRDGWTGGIACLLPQPRPVRPRGMEFTALPPPAAAAPHYTGLDEAAARAGTPRGGWTGGIAGLLPQPRQAQPRRTVFRTLAPPAATAPRHAGMGRPAIRQEMLEGRRPEMVLDLGPAGPGAAPPGAWTPRPAETPAALRGAAVPLPYGPCPLAPDLAPGPGLSGVPAATACRPALFPAFWSTPPAPAARLRSPVATPVPSLPSAVPAQPGRAVAGAAAAVPRAVRPRQASGPLPYAAAPMHLPDRVIRVSNLSPAPVGGLLPLDLRWRPARRLRGGGWRPPAERYFLEMAALAPWPAGLDAAVREDWRAASRLEIFYAAIRRTARGITTRETRP